MSNCNKCKLPISFKKLSNGKFCPTNPDGSDHWDLCKATLNGVDISMPYTIPNSIKNLKLVELFEFEKDFI